MQESALAVIGMHRSGTSAFARTFARMGVDFGDPTSLFPANEFNEEGYWESQELISANAGVFHIYGMDWQRTNPLPDNWGEFPQARGIVPKLSRMLGRIGRGAPVWGWKDPRTTLLLPIYQAALAELGVQGYYCICLRNPMDVAASLDKRDYMSREKALGLWLYYTLSALHYTVGERRLLLRYEDLLKDPAAAMRAALPYLPLTSESISDWSDVASAVRVDLEHNTSGSETIEDVQSDLIAALYRLSLTAATDLEGLNRGLYDEEIERLWSTWNTRTKLRSNELEYSMALTLMHRPSGEYINAETYTADRTWRPLNIQFDAPPGSQVQLHFGQPPTILHVRNVILWNGKNAVPILLKPGRFGFADYLESGETRITLHGLTDQCYFKMPLGGGPWLLQLEIFADIGSSAATETVLRLGNELTQLRDRAGMRPQMPVK